MFGFTLIEVVVALGLLGVTMIAVFGAMRTCAAAAYHSRMLAQSVLLAERLLVETKLDGHLVLEHRKGDETPFSWEVDIVPTPIETLGAIHVQVNWPEQGREQEYELFSFVRMQSLTGTNG